MEEFRPNVVLHRSDQHVFCRPSSSFGNAKIEPKYYHLVWKNLSNMKIVSVISQTINAGEICVFVHNDRQTNRKK